MNFLLLNFYFRLVQGNGKPHMALVKVQIH